MRFRLITGLLVLTFLGFLYFGIHSASADSRIINDLSWPNCGEKIKQLSASGIVGVNDGLDFRPNPCLFVESQLFHNSFSLYLNTGYPGQPYDLPYAGYPKKCQVSNDECMAYNWGYNDALYSINYAGSQDAHSFVWWLDVENVNSWSTDYNVNRQALTGMIVALSKNTFLPTIGFYASPDQWQVLTGSWDNHYPAWVATGSDSKPLSTYYCYISFNGGKVWLSQYTTKLDNNYNCLNKDVNGLLSFNGQQ